MSFSLLAYPLSSQNQRVADFEVPGDEQPRLFSADYFASQTEMDALIQAAYRQIFNEQQMIQRSRQLPLESQLRSGHITVRDFIRGLLISEPFRKYNYDTNNNYRLVQMCIQRVLGRDVYNNQEKLAWSTVVATKGLQGFVNSLLNSEEYLSNFGDNVVPYQRRRILAGRSQGNIPFAHMARYDEFYRDKLPKQVYKAGFGHNITMSSLRWQWQKQTPASVTAVGTAIAYAGGAALALGVAATFLSFLNLITL